MALKKSDRRSSVRASCPETGRQRAVFDLVWANGLQEELSEPVAVLLNEDAGTIALASGAGFRCFTSGESFLQYIRNEVLSGGVDA